VTTSWTKHFPLKEQNVRYLFFFSNRVIIFNRSPRCPVWQCSMRIGFDISFWVALQDYHGVKKNYDITLMLNLEKKWFECFLKNKKWGNQNWQWGKKKGFLFFLSYCLSSTLFYENSLLDFPFHFFILIVWTFYILVEDFILLPIFEFEK
jgi:hypothetical protein